MSNIHVDPEKLRNFAGKLKRFNENINSYFEMLPRELTRLGDTWQDREYEKFKQALLPATRALKRFVTENEKVIPSLLQDAAEIEEYHKRSL